MCFTGLGGSDSTPDKYKSARATSAKINQAIKSGTDSDMSVSTSDPTTSTNGVTLKSPVTNGVKKISL
jgi:hypothetical protein